MCDQLARGGRLAVAAYLYLPAVFSLFSFFLLPTTKILFLEKILKNYFYFRYQQRKLFS